MSENLSEIWTKFTQNAKSKKFKISLKFAEIFLQKRLNL